MNVLERYGVTNVRTKVQGDELLHWGVPTERFWSVWSAYKNELKARGIWVKRTDEGAWLVFAREKRSSATSESRAKDADLDVPVPAGKSLLPYQRAGVAYMLAHPKTLLADPMGLGKTVQAIGLMNVLPELRRILVISPAGLRLNWAREIAAWDVHRRRVAIATDFVPRDANVVITNYDRLAKLHEELRAETWDLIVLDEAHYLKNPDAQRTKLVFGNARAQGLRADRWVSLTGTPILNRPAELWTHVRAYDPKGLGANWLYYHQRYCDARQVYVGGRYVWDIRGASNLEELASILRQRFLLRREKQEVIKDLPPKRHQIVIVEPDASIAASVDAERKLVEDAQNKYSDAITAMRNPNYAVEFEALTRLRHENALAKAPYVARHVVDGLDADQKAVVWAWHRDVAEMIARQINSAARENIAVAVHGEQDTKERQMIVDVFQKADKPRVLVATMGALGVGYTLTRADWAVFAEVAWTPAEMDQAEDRLHRIGQQSSVLVQYLIFDGTLDALLLRTLARKENIIEKVLD